MLRMSVYTIVSRMRVKTSTERVFAVFTTITNVMGKVAILTINSPQRKGHHMLNPLEFENLYSKLLLKSELWLLSQYASEDPEDE